MWGAKLALVCLLAVGAVSAMPKGFNPSSSSAQLFNGLNQDASPNLNKMELAADALTSAAKSMEAAADFHAAEAPAEPSDQDAETPGEQSAIKPNVAVMRQIAEALNKAAETIQTSISESMQATEGLNVLQAALDNAASLVDQFSAHALIGSMVTPIEAAIKDAAATVELLAAAQTVEPDFANIEQAAEALKKAAESLQEGLATMLNQAAPAPADEAAAAPADEAAEAPADEAAEAPADEAAEAPADEAAAAPADEAAAAPADEAAEAPADEAAAAPAIEAAEAPADEAAEAPADEAAEAPADEAAEAPADEAAEAPADEAAAAAIEEATAAITNVAAALVQAAEAMLDTVDKSVKAADALNEARALVQQSEALINQATQVPTIDPDVELVKQVRDALGQAGEALNSSLPPKSQSPEEKLPFKCPSLGNFADPNSKNFISCVGNMYGGFSPIPRDCPGVLCYNAPIDACDWPANVPECKLYS